MGVYIEECTECGDEFVDCGTCEYCSNEGCRTYTCGPCILETFTYYTIESDLVLAYCKKHSLEDLASKHNITAEELKKRKLVLECKKCGNSECKSLLDNIDIDESTTSSRCCKCPRFSRYKKEPCSNCV